MTGDLPAVAVLVSGGGRSLENLCERIDAGELPCRIALVLSNKPGVRALERARRWGLPTAVVPHGDHDSTESFSESVFAEIERSESDLVVLAGFLRLLRLPDRWVGRVINIHPALLPDFGGKGFYGDRVHRAVLAAGVPETGCTVHFVTNEYDRGETILQRRIPVLEDDSVDSLAARVFAEEKLALPEAIARVLERLGGTS